MLTKLKICIIDGATSQHHQRNLYYSELFRTVSEQLNSVPQVIFKETGSDANVFTEPHSLETI